MAEVQLYFSKIIDEALSQKDICVEQKEEESKFALPDLETFSGRQSTT